MYLMNFTFINFQNDPSKLKRKFSSFFKSLVIELDKDLYGPDNHLVEWHRTATTQETDGFQVSFRFFFNVMKIVVKCMCS